MFLARPARGMPFSVGILHNYWTSTLFKGQNAETILSLAATLQVHSLRYVPNRILHRVAQLPFSFPTDSKSRSQTGFMYLQAIGVSTFYRTYPHTLKYMLMFGTLMGSVGLIGSAFATKVRRPFGFLLNTKAKKTLRSPAFHQPFHLVLTLGICFPFASVS